VGGQALRNNLIGDNHFFMVLLSCLLPLFTNTLKGEQTIPAVVLQADFSFCFWRQVAIRFACSTTRH